MWYIVLWRHLWRYRINANIKTWYPQKPNILTFTLIPSSFFSDHCVKLYRWMCMTFQMPLVSSVRSNINVFSLKPDVHRKRRSHGVRRNGLSRRKQRLNRSLDDLLRIAKNNGRHELLHALSSIPVSRLKPILDEADRRSLRHSDWFKLKMIMAFSFN